MSTEVIEAVKIVGMAPLLFVALLTGISVVAVTSAGLRSERAIKVLRILVRMKASK